MDELTEDIEQVEYAKLLPKDERIDLDIEDIKYRVKGKREVHTERGEKLEQFKTEVKSSAPYRVAEKVSTQVRDTAKNIASEGGKQSSMALKKYLAWRKAQQEKRAMVQSPQVKVVYRNAPKPPKQRIIYVDGTARLQQASIPDITGGMKPPDITGGAGGVSAPRIISNQKLPSIVGDSYVRGGILNSLQSSGSTFDKMSGKGGGNMFDSLGLGGGRGGNAFDKLGLGGKGSGIMGSLGIKKKWGFWFRSKKG